MKRNSAGFTLIELVVSMAIIAILAASALSSFSSSQMKGRDGRRKADLQQLTKALEAYYNDNNHYPPMDGGLLGYISACGASCDSSCIWNDGPMCSPINAETVYTQTLPQDPSSSTRKYYYWSNNSEGNTKFALFATLENNKDKDIITISGITTDCDLGTGSQVCNYGVASSNTKASDPD